MHPSGSGLIQMVWCHLVETTVIDPLRDAVDFASWEMQGPLLGIGFWRDLAYATAITGLVPNPRPHGVVKAVAHWDSLWRRIAGLGITSPRQN